MTTIHTVEAKTTDHQVWPQRMRSKTLVAAFLIVLPAVIFYSILFRQAVNLPVQDDYEMILGFLNRMAELNGVSAKTAYFLSAQFNEYKIFLVHLFAWLQLALIGHLNIGALCAIGNGFVLLLAVLLWKMFLPQHKDIASRLLFFVPISWLIFQLRYAETLNWAGPSLSNIPVVLFSVAAIYFLMAGTRMAYYFSLACLVLAIASLGSGMVMIPVGVLILRRSNLRLIGWLVVSAGCIAAYAYHYNFQSSQSSVHHSIFATAVHWNPRFFFSFIGGAPGINLLMCTFLGIALCVFFIVMALRGYFRRNPMVGYCVLFVFLTAVGVTALRSDLGIGESITSRYAMYPILLVIFAWFAIIEEFLASAETSTREGVLTLVILLSILFSLGEDRLGWGFLRYRNENTVSGMKTFEHFGISPVLPWRNQGARIDELDRNALVALPESMRLGIYKPPQL